MAEDRKIEEVNPKLSDPIPDSWVKQAEAELKSGYRVLKLKKFKEKEDVEIHIFNPSVKEEAIYTDFYSNKFNEYFNKGFLLREEMLQKLSERGVWSQKDEDELDNLQEERKEVEFSVAKLKSNVDIAKENKNLKLAEQLKSKNITLFNKLKDDWYTIEKKIRDKISKRESLLTNTIESKAEEEQLRMKLSLCVKFTDESRVWESYDSFLEEKDLNNVRIILNSAISYWMGLSQEIIHDLPNKIFQLVGEVKKLES